MKLQFRHQKFQADAANAVCEVFAGQPNGSAKYLLDQGSSGYQDPMVERITFDSIGWGNRKLVPELTDSAILENLRRVQLANGLAPSEKLEGRYNLTVEMETGVGKTYTYIKTMYELNKRYGWSKFIIVVPSIAIREGVYKSFSVTQEHFAEEYGQKIRYFIYNSSQLTKVEQFASENAISAMIINSQAFNARGKDARRIYMKLDEFQSRRPIDIIAKTNPILIIDEPQSVEGKQTKERLKEFHPLFTLRYSATPRESYNMVYRLDAIEAYNRHLVKKIAVKGVSASGTTATEGYVYLEGLNLSHGAPKASLQFDIRGASGVRTCTRIVGEGYDLYANSNELEEYRDNYIVKRIDGRDESVEFLNGLKLYVGNVVGKVNEDQLRRIQIRETILSHLERERELYRRGIKVLSLFFIDEVSHYRQYDAAGQAQNGPFATMFEEEYNDIVSTLPERFGENAYFQYFQAIPAEKTHAGYFSVDKKGHMTNSKLGDRKAKTSDDADAYDLIMKNKELLLDLDPKRSPVRFIFSHSALREGWDNPNVFQICTLKQSSSEVRKRQEVGRGLRLCVNQAGERMDANLLGDEVQDINVLTVIASESYESFAKGLQHEIAEAVPDRPRIVDADLFENKLLRSAAGEPVAVDKALANAIIYGLIKQDYIDSRGTLTEKFFTERRNGSLQFAPEVAGYEDSVLQILNSVYSDKAVTIEDARKNNIELQVDRDKLAMPQFKALWKRINAKSVYTVEFDSEELVRHCVEALDRHLNVRKIYFRVEEGEMNKIRSKEALESGEVFQRTDTGRYSAARRISVNSAVKYDLIGKLVEETGLTRHTVVQILTGIQKAVFDQFKDNPEEFILKAAQLINDEKATAIIQHITYHCLDDRYDTSIFTEPTIKGKLGDNAIKTKKHLYDYLVSDSQTERDFAQEMDAAHEVAVYVKLPGGFYISTPVGRYNPDWAIAFYEGTVKHIYFVAETKGSMQSMQLREIEKSKIHCAREHFRAINGGDVVYEVVDSYEALLGLMKR